MYIEDKEYEEYRDSIIYPAYGNAYLNPVFMTNDSGTEVTVSPMRTMMFCLLDQASYGYITDALIPSFINVTETLDTLKAIGYLAYRIEKFPSLRKANTYHNRYYFTLLQDLRKLVVNNNENVDEYIENELIEHILLKQEP